ncbi:hypothetical protein PENTCL1PPCAC_17421 [Pristionchus entomophagus]|uniref:C2H2-type domain-containing protein n=1 Tax=Pristionchus entomophagus TaxID=358040 RepID=A0AAV5TLN7_9BILA|nr:hypothetical protein PENTCL1PPCAC_17421 [Pristionchus entomophagus]
MSSPSPSDSFEARLREMAADRLLETVQFAKSKEESVECGSTTALLLSMAQTLRACMRDWPSMEDNALAGIERAEALVELKRSLKEARRLTRSSPLDSLVFVCSDALFLMAEQWSTPKGAATQSLIETFPHRELVGSPSASTSTTSFKPTKNGDSIPPKRPRIEVKEKEIPRVTKQFFPPYPEEDDDEQNESGENPQMIDPLMFFNQNLTGLIKEEDLTNGRLDDTSMSQAEADIWTAQTPLAAFAAVTSSTSQSFNGDSDSRNRIMRFFCSECGVGCVAKSQLDAHMNVHTGNRPFQCDYCEKNYKRKDHLSDHIKKNHPTEFASAKQKKEAMKNKSSAM